MELSIANTALLRECRELVTDRIQAIVTRAVDETAVTLERQTAAGAPDPQFFDAVRELRQRRQEFSLCFEYRFRELFDRHVHGAASTTSASPMPPGCRTVLMEMDRRFQSLLPLHAAQTCPSPLDPQILMAAFSQACAEVTSGEAVRQALMELFQRNMHSDLPRVYGEVNALLARQGITPVRPARRASSESSEPFSTFPGKRPVLGAAGQTARAVIPDDPEIKTHIESLLKGREIPHFASAFALETWAQIMTNIKITRGQDSTEWQLAVKTLENLITGIESFKDPLSRRVAVWKLPGLIHRLKTGMSSINIQQQEQVLFLKTLRAYHLRIIGQRPVIASMPDPAVN